MRSDRWMVFFIVAAALGAGLFALPLVDAPFRVSAWMLLVAGSAGMVTATAYAIAFDREAHAALGRFHARNLARLAAIRRTLADTAGRRTGTPAHGAAGQSGVAI